jgi:hypothetical protein
MSKRDFAVVIGIARYPYLKTLEGPVKDAKKFCKWLVESAQVSSDQIQLVLSKDPPEPGDRPVQDEIDDAFRAVFNQANQLRVKQVEPRRLYVYFAGHGCAGEARHVALLMANALVGDLNRSLDTASYHKGLINLAIFPEQVIFYDCCRNYDQRVVGRRSPWDEAPPAPGSNAIKQYVLYGAGFTEYANERALMTSERRGLFTRALLEGLKSGAAKRRRGKWVVTYLSLMFYVRMRLNQLTCPEYLRQHLGWNPGGVADDLELVEVDIPGLWDVTVTVTAMAAGEVVVYDGSMNEVMHQPISAPELHFQIMYYPQSG